MSTPVAHLMEAVTTGSGVFPTWKPELACVKWACCSFNYLLWSEQSGSSVGALIDSICEWFRAPSWKRSLVLRTERGAWERVTHEHRAGAWTRSCWCCGGQRDVMGHERAPISQPHPVLPPPVSHTAVFGIRLPAPPQPPWSSHPPWLFFSVCAWLMARWHPHMSQCCPSVLCSSSAPSAGSVVGGFHSPVACCVILSRFYSPFLCLTQCFLPTNASSLPALTHALTWSGPSQMHELKSTVCGENVVEKWPVHIKVHLLSSVQVFAVALMFLSLWICQKRKKSCRIQFSF